MIMTLEEKAKAYDEALEKARFYYGNCPTEPEKKKLEKLFSELRESEEETTRKRAIAILKQQRDYWSYDGSMDKFPPATPREDLIDAIDVALSYLEKQKMPEDMGDISDGYHTFNELYYYRMLYNAAFFNLLPKEWVHKSKKHHDGEECFGGGWFIVMANLPTGQVSNHYELKDWDLFQIPEKEIADEWDGHTPQEAAERLYKYLQEKQKEQKHYWKPTETDTALFNKAVTTNKALTPTERAQLDIIRTKFGYCRAVNCSRIVQEEQEPAEWSEEDENIRKQLISICDEWLNGGYNARPCLNDIKWLKNLLEKQKEKKPAEWSEEDERIMESLISLIETIGEYYISLETIDRYVAWLKSLRPQPHWKKSLATADLENSLCDLQDNYHDDSYEYKVLGEAIEFIRCTEPCPSWKPSDEQMNYLCNAVDAAIRKHNESVSGYEPARVLKSLYEDLKNLT